MNKIINGDCLIELKKIASESIDLIVVDIPYNLGKAYNTKLEWDNFGLEYIEWVGKGFLEAHRVLKPSGSFYFFHNDFEVMAEIQHWIKKNTSFNFKQFIVWNKRFEGSPRKGYLDGYVMEGGRINYQKMAEYICYYIKQPDYFPSPFSRIMLDNMKRLNLKQLDISKLELSKNGNITGWVTNKLNGSQLPTREQWHKICNLFGIGNEYDLLEKMYWEERFTFNNQKTHHSVWNYDIPRKPLHPTQKPLELIENIILHSSNEGDLVLDYCSGSGTTGEACKNLNRNYILIEKDTKFYHLSKIRLEKGKYHPYTCDGSGGDKCNKDRCLIPTDIGWICPCNKYTQEYEAKNIDN